MIRRPRDAGRRAQPHRNAAARCWPPTARAEEGRRWSACIARLRLHRLVAGAVACRVAASFDPTDLTTCSTPRSRCRVSASRCFPRRPGRDAGRAAGNGQRLSAAGRPIRAGRRRGAPPERAQAEARSPSRKLQPPSRQPKPQAARRRSLRHSRARPRRSLARSRPPRRPLRPRQRKPGQPALARSAGAAGTRSLRMSRRAAPCVGNAFGGRDHHRRGT